MSDDRRVQGGDRLTVAAEEERLIAGLAADLRPVRRLWHPALRSVLWLAGVVVAGALLTAMADMHEVVLRLREVPDLRWAMVGAVLCAASASLAAFELSVPGRSGWWVVTPLPALALWLGASGWGCLRTWGIPGLDPVTMHEAMGCVRFIGLVSVPLSALMLWMLLRARPLWPGRVAAMGGLAAAAAAASLLTLFHEHDASALDMAMHVVAVGVVVVVCRLAGPRLAERTGGVD